MLDKSYTLRSRQSHRKSLDNILTRQDEKKKKNEQIKMTLFLLFINIVVLTYSDTYRTILTTYLYTVVSMGKRKT